MVIRQPMANRLYFQNISVQKSFISSRLANPVVAFALIWGITTFLFSLQITVHLVPIPLVGLMMIVMNCAFAIATYLYFRPALVRSEIQIKAFDERSVRALVLYARWLRFFWLIGTIIEIVVSGGLPLQWALSGQGFTKDYTNFGIPSFHGLMNAFYLQFMTAEFLLWRVMKRKKSRKIYLIFLMWPLLMLGRGIFLSIVIQSLACFLLFNRINVRKFLRLLFIVTANVTLFGWVGDIRGNNNPFRYLVVENWGDFFDFMPSGFLWIYVYMTSAINNLFLNVDVIEPLYRFEKTFSNMLPSAVEDLLGIADPKNLFVFADSNLNVSTMYAGAVSDFGPIGGWAMVSFVLTFAIIVFAKAQKGSIAAILCYSVVYQTILFSIFIDMFFLLPTIMQMFLAGSFAIRKKRSRHQHRAASPVNPRIAPANSS